MAVRARNPEDQAYLYRGDFQTAVDRAYAEYGEDRGHAGILPYEVLEAIASHESDGIADAKNPYAMRNGEHATGLLQIVPGLGIASEYTGITGNAVTEADLYNPSTAAFIGAVGFSEKAHNLQWKSAADDVNWGSQSSMWWYGSGELITQQNGHTYYRIDPDYGDVNNGITGYDFRDYVQNYLGGFANASENATDQLLLSGGWRNPEDATRKQFNRWEDRRQVGIDPPWEYVTGAYDDAKNAYEKGKDAINSLDDLASFVTDRGNWIRFGVIVLGVAVVGVGITAVL